MKIEATQVINDLIERTRQNLNDAETLKELSIDELNFKTSRNKWNALECIEHLNLYGDFYLPELKNKINESNHTAEEVFKSGWLGNYFAKSMPPKEKLNKMKTFKDKNPLGNALSKQAIDKFIGQQKTTLELLDQARKVSLTKTKTAISISKLLKLRLGDTFRVLIYHNQRHIVQAFNMINSRQ